MPLAVKFMADAVAGGDMKKLQDMMQKGQVDPIEALPKFFAALKKEAAPFLNDFYNTVEARRRKVAKANEDWMKEFMGGGAGEGMADFFKSWETIIRRTVPYAKAIGEYFGKAIHTFNALLLMPGEAMEWFKGNAKDNNLFQILFGESYKSDFMNSLRDVFSAMETAFSGSIMNMTNSTQMLLDAIEAIARVLEGAARTIAWTTGMAKGGLKGAEEATAELDRKKQARENVVNDLQARGIDPRNVDVESMIAREYSILKNPASKYSSNLEYLDTSPKNVGFWEGMLKDNVINQMRGASGGYSNPLNWADVIMGRDPSQFRPNQSYGYQFDQNSNSFVRLGGEVTLKVEGQIDTPENREQISEYFQSLFNGALNQNPVTPH